MQDLFVLDNPQYASVADALSRSLEELSEPEKRGFWSLIDDVCGVEAGLYVVVCVHDVQAPRVVVLGQVVTLGIGLDSVAADNRVNAVLVHCHVGGMTVDSVYREREAGYVKWDLWWDPWCHKVS